MIDQGTAEEMVMRVMDQPRVMRSQYTIVQRDLVYQPDEIQIFAKAFWIADIAALPVPDNSSDYFRP